MARGKEPDMLRTLSTSLVLGSLLVATPALAQTTQTPPATPPAPAPSATAPLLPPKPAATTPTVVAFPTDSRVAFINMQVILGDSNLGKQSMDRLKTLNDRLSAGIAARDKEIQGLTDKIRTQQ